MRGFGFKCEECRFDLHVGCALRSLSDTKEELTLNGGLFHEHPMRLRCLAERNISECTVYELPVEGLTSTAVFRVTIIFTSLACLCPLLLNTNFITISWCSIIELLIMRSKTATCVRYSGTQNMVFIIARSVIMLLISTASSPRIDFYRCVRCNYNLHFSCMPLPPSVKHTFHHNYHPLVLRDRFVDDKLDNEEQYCDACETLRHPEHGVYYCEECNCAADIDCVIPKRDLKKGRQMKDLMLKRLDKDISIAEAKTEELKKKWEMSMKELEELKKKRQELSDSMEAELDRAWIEHGDS
ncbi:hypothetical protein CRG98_034992 [Punica granatum]|uniref:DC1 domain-containing protein n=1 Tax=Punica granatum TaxID=22663 RepID=A0A2I0IKW4_PUNGR|nr:hypothetical protein CRG98_034992 [Punica granatum]